MMQKTTLEIVLTPQEAEQHHRTLHEILRLLNELPLAMTVTYEHTALRADLMRLAARLDDAVLPPVPPPRYRTQGGTAGRDPDPFTPEGDGSAQDVLLGRLVSAVALILGFLEKVAWKPEERSVIERTKHSVLSDWRDYVERGRG